MFHVLSDKIVVVCNKFASKVFNPLLKNRIIITNVLPSGNFERIGSEVRDAINEGYNVVVYPENGWMQRQTIYHTVDMKSGMFEISKMYSIPITPIVVDHIDAKAGILLNSDFNIYVDKTRIVTNTVYEMKMVKQLYERKLRENSFKR